MRTTEGASDTAARDTSTKLAPFRRALIVANPIAGRGRARAAAHELAEGLARAGIENELYFTAARGDARTRLRCMDPAVDLVVSVGGDGTVSEVLDGLVRREVPVMILAMGTGNVMSLDLGLPHDVDGVLDVIASRRARQLDVARVNQRHLSFLVSGIGFDGMVVRELEALRKGPISKLTWARAALRTLARYREPELEVELDGERLAGTYGFVLFSNVIHYGGSRVLHRDARIDDGLFEAYLFRGCSHLGLLGYGLWGMLAGLPGGRCTLRRARKIRVRSAVPVPYQVDGDYKGETPIEIEIQPETFTLLVPDPRV